MPNVDFAKKAVVKVQQRSAFDKSFRNLLTTKCGTLTPLLCDEVIPNSTVNLKLAINATLPPLASETFMNVNLKAEAFFVPSRILMCGFQDFVQGNTDLLIGGDPTKSAKLRVPQIILPTSGSALSYVGNGTLADYLGLRSAVVSAVNVNALPFLAYHMIWDTWYRNSLVQTSCFDDSNYYSTSSGWSPRSTQTKKPLSNATTSWYTCYLYTQLADGVPIGALRQRNFGSDYFTTATPQPQKGSVQKISMELPWSLDSIEMSALTADSLDTQYNPTQPDQAGKYNHGESSMETVAGSGVVLGYDSDANSVSFSIASLRACNSLQQWLERQQLSNNRYVDYLKVNFNANLKDSIAQRPVYLGSASFPVYSKGIYQTAADSNSGNNPFDSVGSRYGHAYAEGSNFIIDHYTAQEHGYIFVLVSLVPEVTYSGGVNKYLMRYLDIDSYGEVANPILQNVGPEPIRLYEFDNSLNDDDSFGVFGYTDRFASWMTRQNELHGLLRDGASLESFALQRTGVTDGISDAFLEIPTNYMDQVTAVDSAISNYGCWIDSYLDYKVVMPLGKYVIPSLQDPAYEHGDTVVVNKRGRIME